MQGMLDEQGMRDERHTGMRPAISMRRTLRYLPPTAALGTAAILQITAVTDLLGEMLAQRAGTWGYLIAGLFGLSVACAAEGGAAYLMDLYDKHLLARDSTWTLKVGMVVYVSGSAAAIHWWATYRHLPVLLSWLLAAMSASALFLYSRGSRWSNREAMRRAGQLDQALPRLALSAKALHPIRWMITLYLISWDPVETTEQARARYAVWRGQPHWWRRRAEGVQPSGERVTEQVSERMPLYAERMVALDADRQGTGERLGDIQAGEHPLALTAGIPVQGMQGMRDEQRTTSRQLLATVEQLADDLDSAFPERVPGRPSALIALRASRGSCSPTRAEAAIRILRDRRMRGDTTENG